jgi:hypothetical protein
MTLSHRWPSALGLVVAAVAIATGPNRVTLAITVSVAALCYLAAAALNRPWVAWVAIIGGSLVVVVGELIGLVWWGAIGIVAAALTALGLSLRVPRRALLSQAVALLAYGGLAVIALAIDPVAGMILAGVTLAGHAGWDLLHYRRNAVVDRSLAEFCLLLDVPLGLALVVLALTG